MPYVYGNLSIKNILGCKEKEIVVLYSCTGNVTDNVSKSIYENVTKLKCQITCNKGNAENLLEIYYV